MYRIIPFVIFFGTMLYLFYGPAPMHKISKIVKKRDCYQLRLIDQQKIYLSSDTEIKYDSITASIKIDLPPKEDLSDKKVTDNFSLALSHQSN